MRPFLPLLLAVITACASPVAETGNDGPLPEIDVDGFEQLVAGSESPLVVNLWASWCIPCRSEAPLLQEAYNRFGDEVRFVGIATEDAAADSAAFLAEFGLEFENYSDRPGSIRGHIGAVGLPVTVFIHPGGDILRTHYGVIDDAALALGIDDLLTAG